MRRHQHKSNNAVLGAPVGWDQKELPCNALPITRIDVDGIPAVCSYWKPSPEELVALNAGHSIELCVLGDTMPPVAMNVQPD